MRSFWLLSLMLVWFLPSAALNKTQRGKLCSKNRDNCIWINEFFNKSRGFPIHNSVDYSNYLSVYCWDGPKPFSVKGLVNIWHSLSINIRCKKDAKYITILFSNTSLDIEDSENKLTYSDSINGTSFYHYAKPYNVLCTGVMYSGRDAVNYMLYADLVFMWRFPILLTVGLFLLFHARNMSRSILFHYGTGVTFGVLASLLVLLYMLSKIVPKKNIIGLGVLAGGFTLAGSFIYWLYQHSLEFIISMWQYFLIYVLVAGCLSFAVVYRFGPVENERTFHLIQWSIQLLALVLIGVASQIAEVGVTFIVIALLFYYVPARYNPVVIAFLPVYYLLACLLSPFNKCFRFFFGKRYKFKFLTPEEYDEQGRVETEIALTELRNFCKQNDVWGTIGKLNDSKRFTRFLAGNSHVTDEEQVDHEWSFVMSSTDVDQDSDNEETVSLGNYSGSPSKLHHSTMSHDSSTRSSSSLLGTSDDSPESRYRPHPSPSRAPLHGRRYYSDSSPSHYRKH